MRFEKTTPWFCLPFMVTVCIDYNLHADEPTLTLTEAGRLISKVPSEIKKIALRCRCQNPLFPGKKLHITDLYLAWDLSNDHYYSRQIQYGDERGTEPKHVVVESWDGREQISWTRYVDKGRPGFSMFGPEPEDAGSVILGSKARTGHLVDFQEAILPLKYPFPTNGAFDEVQRSGTVPKPLGIEEGAIYQLQRKASVLQIHYPSGWLVDHFTPFADHGSLRLQLSDFHLIPSTTLMFPASIVRTFVSVSSGESKSMIRIEPASIKINEDVVLPKIKWRAKTSIQDERDAR